jgi:uncharacterized lipoprotein YajG
VSLARDAALFDPEDCMKILLLSAATAALAGCAGPLPTSRVGPDPADATIPVRAAPYVSVTAGSTDYRPVDPKSWPDVNERVTPRPQGTSR